MDEREGEKERETKEKERMCICASVHALGSTARRACKLFLPLFRKAVVKAISLNVIEHS